MIMRFIIMRLIIAAVLLTATAFAQEPPLKPDTAKAELATAKPDVLQFDEVTLLKLEKSELAQKNAELEQRKAIEEGTRAVREFAEKNKINMQEFDLRKLTRQDGEAVWALVRKVKAAKQEP